MRNSKPSPPSEVQNLNNESNKTTNIMGAHHSGR